MPLSSAQIEDLKRQLLYPISNEEKNIIAGRIQVATIELNKYELEVERIRITSRDDFDDAQKETITEIFEQLTAGRS